MNFFPADLAQLSAIGVGALITLAFMLQKLLKSWKETSVEGSVLKILHTEVERMNAHNTNLVQELSKLQRELVSLNGELYKLTIENQRLHAEVAALTQEISVLKAELSTTRGT